MKVTYQREMKRNYMIIDPETMKWDGYESRMITENRVEGLLKLQIRQMETGYRFYYDITSRQPLSRMLEGPGWNAEQIRRLLLGILETLDKMEDYLLSEDRIYLDADFIYIAPESMQVWLCIVPGMERNFPEAFGKLLELILGKVDHQDKDSVVLAYVIYQETRKENYGVEDIRRLLCKKGRQEGADRKEPEMMNEGERRLEQPEKPEKLEQPESTEERKYKESLFWEDPFDESEDEAYGLIAKISNWFRRLFRRKKKEAETLPEETWQLVFQPEKIDENMEPQRKPQSPGLFEAPENSIEGTVLLADLSAEKGTRRLRSEEKGIEDIPIAYYPFIIGKQENLVDYKLDQETVSRLHVRINRREEQYFIQDLNSTNGTMINGRLLDNNEEIKLKIGDEIRIARYRFIFV